MLFRAAMQDLFWSMTDRQFRRRWGGSTHRLRPIRAQHLDRNTPTPDGNFTAWSAGKLIRW